jgi:predicted Fe-Mo cluster-binding NifX family protein
MNDKVAVPVLGRDVAPCFEVARQFLIANIKDKRKVSERICRCRGRESHCRVKFLKKNRVNVLICNGINLFYCDLLNVSGITVIPNITDSANKAINLFIEGKLKSDSEGSLGKI